MSIPTKSESLFTSFCEFNRLEVERVPAGVGSTPDYRLRFGTTWVAFEIKQFDQFDGFTPYGVSTRTVGRDIRRKIEDARKQVQAAASKDEPAVLLIYNAVDPIQIFGTEEHDFICAMYGDLTVTISPNRISDFFHGKSARLRHDANTSFSAIGHLRHNRTNGGEVTLYENIYAANPLPFQDVPPCIEVRRVSISSAA